MNAMAVGRIEFAPAFASNAHASAAGDITMVRTARVPPAANDNQVGPKIIGLMGFAGAGKTTVANILRERHGYSGPHIKAPLVAMARTLLEEFGVRPSMIARYLDGDLKREVIPDLGRSGTEIQQFLGTEFGRQFCYDDLWLDNWKRAARRIVEHGGRVVQESVRFANEADAVRSMGGIIVEVRRPGVGPLSGHTSESIPVEPDVVIHNDGSIVDLRSRVVEIIAA